MRPIPLVLVACALALGPRVSPAAEPMGPTVVVPIDGQVSKAQFLFLRRAIKEAEKSRAGAIVLHMDTYGGDLHAAVSMLDALGKTRIPTYTFVDRNAGSAGALIALGTDHIYMAPVSAIGAAAPVMGGGENLPEAMNDKVISYFSKYFRSAAEQKGHNPDIAEGFINKDKEVKMGGKTLSEKGSLLTLSPQEAIEIFEERPLLAAGIVTDLEALAERAAISPEFIRVNPTGFEQFALWLTIIAPALLIAGLAGIYLEFKTPGVGLPGILGGISLLLFFLGHNLAGLAGAEVIAVFIIGIGLIFLELVFFPGTLLIALTGAALAMGALFWAMVDRYPDQPLMPSVEMLATPALNMAIALGGGALLVALAANFLPKTPIFRRLILGAELPGGDSLGTGSPSASGEPSIAPGAEGVALTRLFPSGKARFGERLCDVITEGTFVEAGKPIRVDSVQGNRIVVEEIAEYAEH